MQLLTGETSDISMFLQFYFWEEVYNTRVDKAFPSESTEEKGHFVGFGETVGDAMTFKILSTDTKKILYRYNVRSAETKEFKNKRLDDNGEHTHVFIKSRSDESSSHL
jgi:hypothetical protein